MRLTPQLRPLHIIALLVSSSSLSRDTAARLQSCKLLPPVRPTWGSPRSQTQSKSSLGHPSVATASAYVGAAKGLHPCKRPHSPRAPTKKPAAPALPPWCSQHSTASNTAHQTDAPLGQAQRNLPNLLSGESPGHQELDWRGKGSQPAPPSPPIPKSTRARNQCNIKCAVLLLAQPLYHCCYCYLYGGFH